MSPILSICRHILERNFVALYKITLLDLYMMIYPPSIIGS
uniref:Uncharacterized protein n=1 Tax=Siphoviridae sp. ctMAv2 TaxID=2826258 RepID=A0A8S5LSM3_9CAUD|nr:MAG TPA: hypothetical protein [Siphoviridae sp. ctMAv2]